jgi:hypothetical protein
MTTTTTYPPISELSLTISADQFNNIKTYVDTHDLPKGLGDKEAAGSVAAINLALTGKLTDTIPECMSLVIGNWIIKMQDTMPDAMRNSPDWKTLLPYAAGTGREPEKETERKGLIITWLWEIILPTLQPLADKRGFGRQWAEMLDKKTAEAAAEAAEAAEAAYAAYAAAYAAEAADAVDAAEAAYAAYAAAEAAEAAEAANAAAYAANAAAYAANAAAYAATETASSDFFAAIDPPKFLRQLIFLNKP